MSLPIRPSDISKVKEATIPSEVIRIINELIAENFTNGKAIVHTRDVRERINFSLDEWCGIGEMYGQSGWIVSYHVLSEIFVFTENKLLKG